ncbi:MAG TPA: DUF4097 family beta strand repeat-containing protein [Gemmatimonadaceae bacterium]|nr:DUF4097 family beta strand repeat-containing protein [Gemmatimonadaceae bacterium]
MRPRHAPPRSIFAFSLLAVAGSALLAPADAHARQAQRDFDWSGEITQGATVGVFTFAGTVTVREIDGREARIRGTSRNAGADEIQYVTSREGGGVRICALHEDAECTDGGIRGTRGRGVRGVRGRRASADFTVEVPRGVMVRVASGSGDVTVDGVSGDVNASSGSGSVRVSGGAGRVHASSGSGTVTVDAARGPVQASSGSGSVHVTTASGPVVASTGSGNIDVSMAALPGAEDMRFSTGSGSITLRLPADFSANIEASTGSGGIESDFPLQVVGRMSRHNVRAAIGGGGRSLRMSTGSGNIRILRH